jgi:opacity protein-like surface antigen
MSYKASMACAGAFAVAATLSGTAFAAEPAPLPPPVPIFTWTGLYVGGQIGYAWGRDPVSWSGISNDDELAAGTFSQTPQGVIGGAHVGYNLQYNQWLVLGIEGSVDGTSLSHTLAVPVNDVFGDTPGIITGPTCFRRLARGPSRRSSRPNCSRSYAKSKSAARSKSRSGCSRRSAKSSDTA